MSDFVHLHCHSEYSLLDSTIRIQELCSRTKEYGMGAVALTDHGYAQEFTRCRTGPRDA